MQKPSIQRQSYDSALRVLLTRENLDGTEWAIQQLREEGLRKWGPDAVRIATWLASMLDKRAVELINQQQED